MLKRFPIIFILLFLVLSFTAHAVPASIPAKSVMHPSLETFYMVDNAATNIYTYTRLSGNWTRNAFVINLDAGETCHGLLATADRLYITVSGSARRVGYYELSGAGVPSNPFHALTGTPWDAGETNLGGIAINEARDHVYVVDQRGWIYIYRYSAGSYIGYQIPDPADRIPHFDIAVRGDRIFVSNRQVAGAITIYNDAGAVSYERTVSGFTYPTYLTVSGNDLYVAVNGADGNDIAVFNATNPDLLPISFVQSGIVGSNGWTSMALNQSGGLLVFKKSVNAAQTTNNIYAIQTGSISGPGNPATRVATGIVTPSDGLVLSHDMSEVALSNSPDGSFEEITLTYPADFNSEPTADSLEQFDQSGVLLAFTGTTEDQRVDVAFTVSDPDGTDLTATIQWRKSVSGSWLPEWQEQVVRAIAPDTRVERTIPTTGDLEPGNYQWRVIVSDGFEDVTVEAGTIVNGIDFHVIPNFPPGPFGKIDPPNGVTERPDPDGTILFSWEEAVDPEGGPISYTLSYENITPGSDELAVNITTTETFVTRPSSRFTLNNTYRWNVRATDDSGNRTYADDDTRWTFSYGKADSTGPTASILSPTNGAVYSPGPGTIIVNANIEDSASWIRGAEFRVDGGVATAMTPVDGAFNDESLEGVQGSIGLATLADRVHNIEVRGLDREGNWGSWDLVSITVSPENGPPEAFGKLAPANNSLAYFDVTFEWENNGDPEGTSLAYFIRITNLDTGAVVYENLTGEDVTSHTVPAASFAVGNNYGWNVAATDGVNTTWANGHEDSVWKFTYREPPIDTDPPQLTLTSPVNAAIGVLANAPIVLTFSESMNIESVGDAISIVPGVAGITYTWNMMKTELTINHADFAIDTEYRVTVADTARDLSTPAQTLVAGDVPNPFIFNTGAESGGDSISDAAIVRNEDGTVTISWTAVPADRAVDIFARTCEFNAETNTYSTYFSANPADWTRLTAGATISYTDSDTQALVGSGFARYYKIMPAGEVLDEETDLTTGAPIVGKFDLSVGVEPERFFISLPLVPASTAVADIFSGQIEELDIIFVFNAAADPIEARQYFGASWVPLAGVDTEITNLQIGYSYGFATTRSRYITIVGTVLATPNERPITGTLSANWIGNAYPAPVAINVAGLEAAATGASPIDAATIYHFDSTQNLYREAPSSMSTHTGADTWTDLSGAPNTTILEPGQGFMLTEPSADGITWTQPRGY